MKFTFLAELKVSQSKHEVEEREYSEEQSVNYHIPETEAQAVLYQ